MNWFPVSDALPSYNTSVLVTDGEIMSVAKYVEKTWIDDSDTWEISHVEGYEWEWEFDNMRKVTHWSPLPHLPTE